MEPSTICNSVGRIRFLALIVLSVFSSAQVLAAGITIGSGGSISVGSGAIHVGCGDLVNSGTLSLGSGVLNMTGNVKSTGQFNGDSGLLEFGGDWSNNGAFTAGTSTVAVVDECGNGSITFAGNSDFYNLSMVTTAGKTVVFEAGAEQKIASDLVFTGSPGNLLTLRSSIPGAPVFTSLALAGTQFIDWVDVADNVATEMFQHLAPTYPTTLNSVDSGGNSGWFIENMASIPTLSGMGMLIFVALILLGAGFAHRRVI
ncbi:MAG: hypothetical protein QNK19_15365 [Xanthomonadales bacterium]|nr:hypothetical protein [Xanthomonadales bacterium]